MSKFTKPWMIAGVTAAAGLTLLGATAIHAAASTTTNGPMSGLVQAIATKFNLKTSDVQAVVDAQKAQIHTQHAADFKTRLDQAVKDGKLTQAQEDLIVAKEADEKTFMESLQSMSETDRKAALQTQMADLKKWATNNNIPTQYVPFGPGGHGGHRMYRGHFEGAPMPSATP